MHTKPASSQWVQAGLPTAAPRLQSVSEPSFPVQATSVSQMDMLRGPGAMPCWPKLVMELLGAWRDTAKPNL